MKAEHRDRTKAEKELAESRRKEKEERSYDRLFKSSSSGGAAKGGAGAGDDDADAMGLGVKPTEDASAAVAFEDDFM